MTISIRQKTSFFICLALFVQYSFGTVQNKYQADIIVYGGTSAAVIAAVEASENGNSVLIVSPDKHLGGLSSGGLGWTDAGNKKAIGGLSKMFYHRIWKHYNSDVAWKFHKKEEYDNGREWSSINDIDETMWVFEPHVAEQVFEQLIEEYDIKVFRDEWLDREEGVIKKGDRIVSFKTLSGLEFNGKIFIDATYEGDLMASAEVSYHVGREAADVYGEEWNGVQTGVLHHHHWFATDISPYKIAGDPSSGILPRISSEPPGEKYSGDDKVQAYCFRTCLTDYGPNRVPFPKPKGYDASQYELLARVFDTGWEGWFNKFDPMPNHKTDTNNHGPFSSDNIGMNYDYPDASYERREQIIKEHENYQKGLYWFVANDKRVPESIRSKMQQWGLAKDEFTDNGNWPHQLYIREARRMIGEFVITENELLKRSKTPKSIGMGSYAMDSHNVQRYIKDDGSVQNEGDIGVGTKGPYQIAYDALVPKEQECANLLVPVCVSSSHIAFGSIRMEPVFMILGQSAAAAAGLAIKNGTSVQDVPYEELRGHLLKKGQVLSESQMKK